MAQEITAEKLERLQRNWAEASSEAPLQGDYAFHDFLKMRDALKEMGFDLAQDATYELLQPGLTKQDFDTHYTHALVRGVLKGYHWTVTRQREEYLAEYSRRRAANLKGLIEKNMPMLEDAIAVTGLPASLSPLMRAEAGFMLQAYRDGTLEAEMKQSAVRAAHDKIREADQYKSIIDSKSQEDRLFEFSKKGLAAAESLLELIALAGNAYAPGQIYKEYGKYGGWDKQAGQIMFSREEAEKMKNFFLTQNLARKFVIAKEFQDQGHFVLDESGSGHGIMVMPMQDIAEKLKEYGYDLRDPATYKAIDTDMNTFCDCYDRERKEVAKDDKYNLVKPALKF